MEAADGCLADGAMHCSAAGPPSSPDATPIQALTDAVARPPARKEISRRRRAPCGWLRAGLVSAAICGASVGSGGGSSSHRNVSQARAVSFACHPSIVEAGQLPRAACYGRSRGLKQRSRCSTCEERGTGTAVQLAAGRSGSPYGGANQGTPQDPSELFKQLFGADFPQPGAAGSPQGGMPGFGGTPGDPNADPFAALMGGQKKEQKTSDAFITDRFPVLQKAKMFVMPAFFLYCHHRGWVGRWGLIMGCFAKSYFDMLAVPLRVLPNPLGTGKAYIVCQFYVDTLVKVIGYFINVARGKAKFPPDLKSLMPMPTMPPGVGDTAAGTASPFGMPSAAAPTSPFGMPSAAAPRPTTATVMPPTAPTAATPPPPSKPPGPPSRSPPTIVDADVTFLD